MLPSAEMMHQCAPNISPVTLAAIIQVESGGNAYAIGVNGPIPKRPHPQSIREAAMIARYYINQGYSVDLGLMQINSSNLKGLGLTIEKVLDPCTNLQAGSRILSRGYAGASKHFGPGQKALRAALSAYNTGNYEWGFKNGYVAKYYRRNDLRVKLISRSSLSVTPTTRLGLPLKSTANPYLADTTVYRRQEYLSNIPITRKEPSYEHSW